MQWLKPDILRIRAPLRCSDSKIQHFIASNRAWINKQKQYHREYPGLPEKVYRHAEPLWILGVRYQIRVVAAQKNSIQLSGDYLNVHVRKREEATVKRLVVNWIRQFAEHYFAKRLAYCHAQFPCVMPAYSFKVRKMKRQWGNCSRKGEIKLNLALIQYPEHCIDYVIWHELVHLIHFHHGAQFYALLEKCCPDWLRAKTDLEQFSG
jgi:predicted metal-dependent hydrolase